MNGTNVRYTTRNHETFDGYLTGPDGNAKAPAILLITAIFGVDQEMRELADAWANDGFVVSVPDIFWRQTPGPTADMTVAFDRYGKFDPVQGMRDIDDLVTDLKSRPRCNGKVAILGFCVAPMEEVRAIQKAFAGRSYADVQVYEGVGPPVARARPPLPHIHVSPDAANPTPRGRARSG